MLYEVETAAADATVGFDLVSGQTWRISSMARRLQRIALTGSAAAGDTRVEMFVGNYRVGEFFNSATAAPQFLRDAFPIGVSVPAGEPLVVNVVTAPTTNPIYLMVEI